MYPLISVPRSAMKFSRWVSLAAGCLVMSSSGLNYSFSIVSPGVKDVFGFTDMQISTIASMINLGGYLAIISGQVRGLHVR